jgi:predicted transcriptional regulator
MTTTTIRLPQDLKARVAAAAERTGLTTHGFILQAIAEKADEADQRGALQALAGRRFEEIAASGQAIRWSELRAYLRARVAGRKPRRPAARKLAR